MSLHFDPPSPAPVGAGPGVRRGLTRALYLEFAVAVVARFDAQAALARRFGADLVLNHEPRLAVIEELVAWGGGRLRQPLQGLPMAYPGSIDVVYGTGGKPETFEVGIRVLAVRGALVKAGVHAPGRWEWSPLYVKEINRLAPTPSASRRSRGLATRHRALPCSGRRRTDWPAAHAHTYVRTAAVARRALDDRGSGGRAER